jgi:hypothetical protein
MKVNPLTTDKLNRSFGAVVRTICKGRGISQEDLDAFL